MTLSESFDPPADRPLFSAQAHHQCSEADYLSETSAEAFDLRRVEDAKSWQNHLLPISCIAAEDSLAVLRFELERAHQFLRQQQSSMDLLKEQLTNRELQLQHVRSELASVQQTCEYQSAKLTEADGICRGLKTQLRRQQQRVLQYRNLLSKQMSSATYVPLTSPSIKPQIESNAAEVSQSTKSNPVCAWSAPYPIGLTGPLASYRELATIRMTAVQAASVSPKFARDEGYRSFPSMDDCSKTNLAGEGYRSEQRIELPNFTRSASA